MELEELHIDSQFGLESLSRLGNSMFLFNIQSTLHKINGTFVSFAILKILRNIHYYILFVLFREGTATAWENCVATTICGGGRTRFPSYSN